VVPIAAPAIGTATGRKFSIPAGAEPQE